MNDGFVDDVMTEGVVVSVATDFEMVDNGLCDN